MNCELDNKKIEGIPFKCKNCNKSFCSEHRLPENHNCEIAFRKYKKNKEEFFKKTVSEISKIQKKKIQKEKRKKRYYEKKFEEKKTNIEVDFKKLGILIGIIIIITMIFKILT